MYTIREFLERSDRLSTRSVEQLVDHWQKKKSLHPKETLIAFQQCDMNLYFVAKGCMRLFVINDKDEETTLGFGYENTLITSFQSFIAEKPSNLSVDAILESELVSIPKSSLMDLIAQHDDIAQWYRFLIEHTLNGHIQRQVELLTLRPRERYEIFTRRSGHLVNSIPLKLIASYLMMTPETLSRIRAKIS